MRKIKTERTHATNYDNETYNTQIVIGAEKVRKGRVIIGARMTFYAKTQNPWRSEEYVSTTILVSHRSALIFRENKIEFAYYR